MDEEVEYVIGLFPRVRFFMQSCAMEHNLHIIKDPWLGYNTILASTESYKSFQFAHLTLWFIHLCHHTSSVRILHISIPHSTHLYTTFYTSLYHILRISIPHSTHLYFTFYISLYHILHISIPKFYTSLFHILHISIPHSTHLYTTFYTSLFHILHISIPHSSSTKLHSTYPVVQLLWMYITARDNSIYDHSLYSKSHCLCLVVYSICTVYLYTLYVQYISLHPVCHCLQSFPTV